MKDKPLSEAINTIAKQMAANGRTPITLYICEKSYAVLLDELKLDECSNIVTDIGIIMVYVTANMQAWYLSECCH